MKKLTLISLFAILSILSFSQTFTVIFEFDKSDLDDKSITSLKDFIRTNKPKDVNLTGFADTVGNADYNKLLVKKRLEAVENAFLKIDKKIKIEKINFGEEKSTSNDSEFRKVDITFSKTNYREKKPNYKKPQSFMIDNMKDTIIECSRGTKIKIPHNTLVLKDTKSSPQGLLKLEITEYYAVHEMIDANLSTQSGNEILETGGMLFIQATFHEKECVIKDNSNIEIHFREITESDSMSIFTGNKSENGIDWKLANDSRIDDSMIILKVVENTPSFLGGGTSAFLNYVNSRLNYPIIAQENGIQGKVIVSFTIDEYGLIKNPVILESVHPSLDYEVLRAISSTPLWTPGTQEGQPVSVRLSVPFNFVLDGGLPVDKNNRITTKSEYDTFMQNDSVIQKYKKTNEFKSEFYFRTNKLGWINCDKFYRNTRISDIKILVETVYESYFALFNRNRSIMRPNLYNDISKIRVFNNIPLDQNALIIGFKIVNEETYFTSFEAKPTKDTYTPIFEKVDKNELINKMKKLGL
ncbi:MAG: TonB family protein [Bacteroidales bacterium]|nr:TonB family protein [Bacteroidales bacterium]